ncbi:hypothetical protein E4100_00970 [Soehngenia longivitae]|uniref:DUF8052 domain-containing protein n=1 Tax=Soehngenia longivitae TaxID=2562294 RepID=A0A4Z0DA01_9FIRM|nr:hypothetical protein [Soehngenia longivitae]TFZ41738.1 hypothetical protein E4100_00970 [Soehngenia longivitae]
MDDYRYLESLKLKLSRYFDIEDNFILNETTFDMKAKCTVVSERYFFTKNNVIDSFNTYEYYLVKVMSSRHLEEFKNVVDNILKALETYEIEDDHMRTVINIVFILSEHIEKDVENYINKFKYSKNFKFGLKGWADISLILINLHDNKILANKKGKEVIKVFPATNL